MVLALNRDGMYCARTHRSIPAVRLRVRLIALEHLRVGWLQVLFAWRLHLDDAAVRRPEADGAWVLVGRSGLAVAGDHLGSWRIHCDCRGRRDEMVV